MMILSTQKRCTISAAAAAYTGIPRYSALRLALFRYSALASFPPTFPWKYTAFLCVYTTAVCKPMARHH
jgi:hypothetical protein